MISIIMGVYNCEGRVNLLRKSIDSLLCQTYTKWELIICDDGSTDGTRQLLNKLCDMDCRIKVIGYKENRGLAYALNECIKHAKGRFIARQDDDDISQSERLYLERAFLNNNPIYDFVGCSADVYDENGIYGKYDVVEKPSKYNFLWNSPFIHPTVMFSRESLEKVNGYRVSFETNRCEDYDIFMRMYAKGLKGYNMQRCLYEYYIKRETGKYRSLSIRLNEAVVRLKGFWKMGILWLGMIFVIKPIILALLPMKALDVIRRYKY